MLKHFSFEKGFSYRKKMFIYLKKKFGGGEVVVVELSDFTGEQVASSNRFSFFLVFQNKFEYNLYQTLRVGFFGALDIAQ